AAATVPAAHPATRRARCCRCPRARTTPWRPRPLRSRALRLGVPGPPPPPRSARNPRRGSRPRLLHDTTRPLAGRATVPPHGPAPPTPGHNAVWIAPRLLVCGGVAESLGIAQHEIRPHPWRDPTAIMQAEPLRRPRSQSRDRLLNRDERLAKHESPEESRGR